MLHVIAVPSGQKSSVAEHHSQAFRVLSHLYLIISERCHEVAFDAIPCQGRANLKGRNIEMSVLHSAAFSFYIQDVLGFITFLLHLSPVLVFCLTWRGQLSLHVLRSE